MIIRLTKFKTLITGNDGGRRYVVSDVVYGGEIRRLVVFFDKPDEQKLEGKTEITVEGELIDEKGQSLNLRNARLLEPGSNGR